MQCNKLDFYQRHVHQCLLLCLEKYEQYKILKESMKGKFKDVCNND